MKTNVLRGFSVIIFLIAIIAAYLIGKNTGEREAIAAAKANSEKYRTESRASLTALGDGVTRPGSKDDTSTLDAASKRNVKTIISQARAKMQAGMMNPSGMMRALAILDGISDAEIQEALAEIEKTIKEPQQKMMFGMVLLGRWAEKDGPGALAYAEEHFESKNPMMMGVKSTVVSSWAQSDPNAAWDWYLKQEDEPEQYRFGGGKSMALMGIIGSLAMKDVDLAFERLSSIEDEGQRQIAMQGLGQAAWDEDRRGQILDRIATIEDEAERSMARNSIVSQWVQMDPDMAIEWASSLEGNDRSTTIQTIAQSMNWSDPERSGDLLIAEAQTPEERAHAYSNTISSWVHNDPNSAGEWLGRQDQGPELDNARQQFANTIAGHDPESAMAWANSITAESSRNNTVQSVYLQWRNQDAAAANAALINTGLSAEQIQNLQSMETPVRNFN